MLMTSSTTSRRVSALLTDKNAADFVTAVLIWKFILFIGANLSEERFAPNPFPKTLNSVFSARGIPNNKKIAPFYRKWEYPLRKKRS